MRPPDYQRYSAQQADRRHYEEGPFARTNRSYVVIALLGSCVGMLLFEAPPRDRNWAGVVVVGSFVAMIIYLLQMISYWFWQVRNNVNSMRTVQFSWWKHIVLTAVVVAVPFILLHEGLRNGTLRLRIYTASSSTVARSSASDESERAGVQVDASYSDNLWMPVPVTTRPCEPLFNCVMVLESMVETGMTLTMGTRTLEPGEDRNLAVHNRIAQLEADPNVYVVVEDDVFGTASFMGSIYMVGDDQIRIFAYQSIYGELISVELVWDNFIRSAPSRSTDRMIATARRVFEMLVSTVQVRDA